MTQWSPDLRAACEDIEQMARDAGLDFHEVQFHTVDHRQMNELAAYGGFPVRYPHWRFGMEYESLAKGHRYGMSRIYELVTNTDPSVAYLQTSNSETEQKLVVGHVFAHADFFKNNLWLARADKDMARTLATNAFAVRRAYDAHGRDKVEAFLDRCLACETLIDPYGGQAGRLPDHLPTRDVLGWVLAHGRLAGWQKTCLEVVRGEALYFAPIGMTKIMNEGWATFWHSRLMTGGALGDCEIVQYADRHSGAVHASPGQMNPYKLGIEIWRALDRRLGGGSESLNELLRIRRIHNDVTFVEEFLCHEAATRAALLAPGAPSDAVDMLREQVVAGLGNRGLPLVELVSADDDELVLRHVWEGQEIQLAQAQDALDRLAAVWGGPVHLDTEEGGKERRLSSGSRERDAA